jgi:tRNA modification GTPase
VSTHAAVTTGPGAGAIATIQLFGDAAETVLQSVFRRTDGKTFEIAVGRILLGDIVEGGQSIDQVTVGCENPDTFAIHCHGNPLIVERIMGLLQRHGVQPVRAEQLLARVPASRGTSDTIAIEAKLALTTVKTIEGARIITNQVKAGLAQRAKQWMAKLDSLSLDEIAAQAKRILEDSEIARLILSGCTIALVGPPNTGKSTLLNTLAGREKAIVMEIAGTTRDWVSAEIHIPPLAATVLDTAGLDAASAAGGHIDQAAQRKSLEALDRADLILLVLDASQPADQLSQALADRLVCRRTITVLNKADLVADALPEHLRHTVRTSAKLETGITDLIQAIHEACSLTDFSPNAPVVFTDRQQTLVERLSRARSQGEAVALVTELLHAPLQDDEMGDWPHALGPSIIEL